MIIRPPIKKYFLNHSFLEKNGLTWKMLFNGINYTYKTLDKIENTLIEEGAPRLSKIGELSILSSMIGNFFATGIIKGSGGLFERADSHKYQDLRSTSKNFQNIEIKMSIEKNKPKAHLPKEGKYLTCRYVLGNEDGTYSLKKRGEFIWIWEIRLGYLFKKHFNISNTENDSGKTAVVNSEGMKQLVPVFFNENHCPYKNKSKFRRTILLK
jgi:hypothetical protein